MEGHRSDGETGRELECQDCDHWKSEERTSAGAGAKIKEVGREPVDRGRRPPVSGEDTCCFAAAAERASFFSFPFCCRALIRYVLKRCGTYLPREICQSSWRNWKTWTRTLRAGLSSTTRLSFSSPITLTTGPRR